MAVYPQHALNFNREMLAHTYEDAVSQVGRVRYRSVFNLSPLLINCAAAFALALPLLPFAYYDTPSLLLGASRLYTLDDRPWPRRAMIEVVGLEVLYPAASGEEPESHMISFQDQKAKVAKGSSVILRVQADARAHLPPDVCVVYYRTDEGDRGRVNAQKFGRIKSGTQQYAVEGRPFKGVLSGIHFDVQGHDHRVRNYFVEVVESPAVVRTELACTFPDYMVDPDLSSWLPRTTQWIPGAQLPQGTDVTLHAQSNKDLSLVRIRNPETGEDTAIKLADANASRQQFTYRIPHLDHNAMLDITLYDADGLRSEYPHRISIAAVKDEPPRLEVSLRGIGTAVTPDVQIPVKGKITDDYAVDKSWFEINTAAIDGRQEQFARGSGGSVDAMLDFRALRSLEKGLELKAGDKLILAVQAADKYDLDGGPNIGSSDRFQLDVVAADELLAMLEVREAELRRRFEQIIEETAGSRDLLILVKSGKGDAGTEPGDATKREAAPNAEPGDQLSAAQQTGGRAQSLRVLRVQEVMLRSQKLAGEILGVALAFDDIREELVNNRVDSEDRKNRLQNEVSQPLRQIGEQLFPQLDRRLETLQSNLDDDPAREKAADTAITQVNDILLEMDKVLQRLIKFETFNELLDIVRDLIKEQEDLIGQTKSKQALDLLQ
jgi:hypothetical protein